MILSDHITSEMESEKRRIIEFALDKFLREGFYKTTMDDIARDLRISKKTIYKYFSSKEVLVTETSLFLRKNVEFQLTRLIDGQKDAIGKITVMLEFIGRLSLKISDRMLIDLQRHLPHVWTEIDNFRAQMIDKNFSKIIDAGKKEGLVKDYPTGLLITLYISAIRSIVNPTFIMEQNFSFREAMEITFDILLNGLLTDKGEKLFSERHITNNFLRNGKNDHQ